MISPQLKAQIQQELTEINVCTKNIQKYTQKLQAASNPEEREILTKAIGSDLHSFYTGAERIFEQIAKKIDKTSPLDSARWHQQLLQQMTAKIPKVREPIISESNFANFDELRGFRHVMRSNYAHKLDTNKVIKLATKIPSCYQALRQDLEQLEIFTSQ